MDKKNFNNDEIEIDLSRLFGALLKRAWLIGIVAVLCAVLTLVGTVLFVAPKYDSSTMFYVNNSALSLEDMDFSISTGDISASKSLVKTYIVILNSRETLNDVIDYAGVNRTYSEVKRMIQAESSRIPASSRMRPPASISAEEMRRAGFLSWVAAAYRDSTA